ncbi:hypothetical protein ACGFIF_27700 [Kribbella sp. NPDC049174]|uniref:hypothetical protein n=1 Tax=Kribbella sp. NPDC049174 TaxID=3364112 RepID=UPI00371DB97D
MEIKTLDLLQQADDRSLAFTPMGLGHMPAADAAEYQQSVVARIELADTIAAGTRQSFDRLRTVYAYGVLCYEAYTLVYDQALLTAEQALRDRFISQYQPAVTFADKHGNHKTVTATSYSKVIEFLKANRGFHFLVVGDGGPVLEFRGGMLKDLTIWARRLGLLCGQRNRHHEWIHAQLRNYAAHPSDHLTSPVEAARELHAVAELINQLWGRRTVGGKYYPAPKRRDILALGWGDGLAIQVVTEVDALRNGANLHHDWNYVIVRAVADDPDLIEFHSQYELTAYPTELLWGPGTAAAGEPSWSLVHCAS